MLVFSSASIGRVGWPQLSIDATNRVLRQMRSSLEESVGARIAGEFDDSEIDAFLHALEVGGEPAAMKWLAERQRDLTAILSDEATAVLGWTSAMTDSIVEFSERLDVHGVGEDAGEAREELSNAKDTE